MYCLQGHEGATTCAEFSPNGDYFVSGSADEHVCMQHMQLLSLYVSIFLCSMIKHYCASSCVIAIFVCATMLAGRQAGNSQFQGFCDEISTQTSFRRIFYSIVLHYICTLFLCWDCFHMFGLGQVMVWRTNFDQTARAPQGAELTNLAECVMFQFCNCAHYQLLPIT